MNTGLKTIDNLLSNFGIRIEQGADECQSLRVFQGGDVGACNGKIPFCMMQKIMHHPAHRQLRLLYWYLPHKQAKLASFLIDDTGEVIEQVYFQRDARHVEACRRIHKLVSAVYRSREASKVLAA